MKNIEQKHWDSTYQNQEYRVYSQENRVIQFLDAHVPLARAGEECFEIGCFPCGFLSYIGLKKKYIVNGIDYSDLLGERTLKWLDKIKVSVGSIKKGNFFELCKEEHKKYDLVYSCGFVEHFKDYKKIIKLHDKFVKRGGYLIITAPNYRGKIMYMLHRFFDFDNLIIHNIKSMNPDEWKEVLEKMNYEILFSDYFGEFEYGPSKEMIEKRSLKRCIYKSVEPIIKYLNHTITGNAPDYSSNCGIVARKK